MSVFFLVRLERWSATVFKIYEFVFTWVEYVVIITTCSSKFPSSNLSASSITKYLIVLKENVLQLSKWSASLYQRKLKMKPKETIVKEIKKKYLPGVAMTMWGWFESSIPWSIIPMPPTITDIRKLIGFPMIWNWSAIYRIFGIIV